MAEYQLVVSGNGNDELIVDSEEEECENDDNEPVVKEKTQSQTIIKLKEIWQHRIVRIFRIVVVITYF
jgi:hypothetical protein